MNVKTITRFEAPLPAVFKVFSDLENAADRISGIKSIEMLTEGPMQVGTRWRETRTFMKRDATEEMEITAFEPDKHYSVGAESCGCVYETHFASVPTAPVQMWRWKCVAAP